MPLPALLLALAAAFVHALWNLLLARARDPIARGVAPALVLLAGIVVHGYGTSVAQAAGVVLVGLGVLAIRGPPGEAPLPMGSSSGSRSRP